MMIQSLTMAQCSYTEYNSYETCNIYPNLIDQQQFRLNKINEIKNYFTAEIKERELINKRILLTIIASFYYFDKSLIVISVATGSTFIVLFAAVIGAPVVIAKASFSLAFSPSTGIVKKLLKTTRNKKKKHNQIVMLARSKLNSTESKISETLINSEISHKDNY